MAKQTEELGDITVADLRERAKEAGIAGASSHAQERTR